MDARDERSDWSAELVDQKLIDYVSLSQGNFNTIDTHLPDRHYKPVPFQDLHAKLKAAVPSATVIAATRIVTPAQAEVDCRDKVWPMVLRWDARSRSIRSGRGRRNRERRTASAFASVAIIAGTACTRAAPCSPACTIPRWAAKPTAGPEAREGSRHHRSARRRPCRHGSGAYRGRARPSRRPVREGARSWAARSPRAQHSAAMRNMGT